ncbi:MAG: hypothetical protein ABI967_00625 [bacterium]
MFCNRAFPVIQCLSFALVFTLQSSCHQQNNSGEASQSSPQATPKSTPPPNSTMESPDTPNDNKSENVEERGFLTGEWAGPHIRLNATEKGATVEYDCAHGTITQRVELTKHGRFDARGTHENETAGHSGGPAKDISIDNGGDTVTPKGATASQLQADYAGRVTGNMMTLTVTREGQTFGTFALKRGASVRLHKCLS